MFTPYYQVFIERPHVITRREEFKTLKNAMEYALTLYELIKEGEHIRILHIHEFHHDSISGI